MAGVEAIAVIVAAIIAAAAATTTGVIGATTTKKAGEEAKDLANITRGDTLRERQQTRAVANEASRKQTLQFGQALRFQKNEAKEARASAFSQRADAAFNNKANMVTSMMNQNENLKNGLAARKFPTRRTI